MKIRTRAFLLGLLPTLLVAAVLTTYHIHGRLNDLDAAVSQQGMITVRNLASSAEYDVISGNQEALGKLLEQTILEPGVVSALVAWPDQTKLVRGRPVSQSLPLYQLGQSQIGKALWFVYPVRLKQLSDSDLFAHEKRLPLNTPLAWVAISIDLQQKQAIARQFLLGSLGITLLGLILAVLLIHKLVLTGIQPLLDIVATVKKISTGSFGARMEVTAHSPELRQLQDMVNQLSESLQSYQLDMEAKVGTVTAELEHKQKEAEQANVAKSKFLAAASHDLRQPMHAIGLYVESLKFHIRDSTAKDTLAKIERSILSMVELFNAILDVTKLEAGAVQPQFAPVRIRKLFLRLADEYAAESDRKGLSLRVHAPDLCVDSDEILLERIFRNLLSNALRHTRHGGVLLAARRHQGLLRLQIWDTGSGISPEDQLLIFQEFYQAGRQETESRHGMGLGLAIVQRLASLLGHPLQVYSVPGKGTVFSLDVAAVATPSAQDEQPADLDRGPLNGYVVVVDDEPEVRDALGRLLQQWGMRVQLLRNLQQVRQEIMSPPDIALLDHQLGNSETGLMAAGEIRRRWGMDIPIVLITGDTRAETFQTLSTLGYPVLYKPIQPAQLRLLLHKSLLKRVEKKRA